MSDDFDVFWRAYPRREGKKDAQKAWSQLRPDENTMRAILAALDWQRTLPGWLKDDGQFIPLPATYLRGERWTDEPPRMRLALTDPRVLDLKQFRADMQRKREAQG